MTATTSWNRNFDPVAMVFVTGGYSTSQQEQQWKANRAVNDCGELGFGFNSSAGAQDICVNNTYRTDSMINPETPFSVYAIVAVPACGETRLLGALSQTHREGS